MQQNDAVKQDAKKLVHELKGRPPLPTAIALGLQHVLAMFVGNLTPLLIVGGAYSAANPGTIDVAYLAQCAMVLAGITTLVQLYKLGPIGSGLPIVMGTSSAFIGVNSAIAMSSGWAALTGATLLGGVFELGLGSFMKKLRRFFPPLVTGVTVLSIGITLIPVGVQNFAGGGSPETNPNFGSMQNLLVAGVVLLVVILLRIFGKGIFGLASLLIATLVGYAVAIVMYFTIPQESLTLSITMTNLLEGGLISVPIPLRYGIEFRLDAIIPMLFMFVVTAIETIGDTTGVAEGGLGRMPTDTELRGTVLADGFSSILASLFNISALTSFSQNVGLIRMTRIVNLFSIATGAVFLIVAGFFRPIGQFFANIPPSVLGGAVLCMFASIAVTGISLLSKVDFNPRNTLIIAIALGVGIGFGQGAGGAAGAMEHFPTWLRYLFGGHGIAAATLIALVLNLVMPKDADEQKAEEAAKNMLETEGVLQGDITQDND